MRYLLLALISLAFAGCASTPKEPVSSVEIVDIIPRYIPERNFMRIGEYLTGAENKGNRVIIRSQPEERSGYYFTLLLDEKVRKLPRGTTITGEFHTPFSTEVKTHEYTMPDKRPKTKEVFVGLTGSDWPDADEAPSAWRFTIYDANGKQMAQRKSFLWSL